VHRRTTGRRAAAAIALAAALWTLGVAVVAAFYDFPRGLLFLAGGLLAVGATWETVLRRGWARLGAICLALAALGGMSWALVDDGFQRLLLFFALGVLVWHAGARIAFDTHVALPPAEPPRRPVLFVNPRSGDGKAARFGLVEQAKARDIETVELHPGDDLERLVRDAVARGADGLAMAGGDGSQAVVAAVAAERGLPYACIPSGTRNHFALDLGVDREDVVGALDAFVDGGERVVDLAEANGRVFVNNVSLGIYAEAVQQAGYRQRKIRTLLATMPLVVNPTSECPPLRWTTPGGRVKQGAAVVLVSNGQYRLGGAAGAGSRPSLTDGVLGVTVLDPRSSTSDGPGGALPWRQFTAAEFVVDSEGGVPAGIDGEAVVLEAPVRFRNRPAALRVRVARRHPGASPSAIEPVGALNALRALAVIATGRDPHVAPARPRPPVPTG
jgi:diacylglycerol kinase family enzyme